MAQRFTITAARSGDCPALPAIERAASELFRGLVPESLFDDVFDEEEFREAQEAGLLWVARSDGAPVGFALVERLASGLPHLEEIDVHPDYARRGLGAKLLRAVCEWAARAGHSQLTLTTFRDVAWNMPFYARMGFEPIPDAELPVELEALVRAEAARGLARERRVVMRYGTHDADRVVLRPTHADDLDFVLALERQPENRELIGQWSREEHDSTIARADREHWIAALEPGGERVGYLIAFDLRAAGLGVYLKRIAVGEKSRGLGRAALEKFLRHVEADLGAASTRLAVAADNARAQRVYTALGFRVESLAPAERESLARLVDGFSERMQIMLHRLEE